MTDGSDRSESDPRRRGPTLGVLCAEAQADGVPCHELGRDCETCAMALDEWKTRKTNDVPEDGESAE